MEQIHLYHWNGVGEYALNIKRMEDIYDASEGETDQAHRHDYYSLIWVKKGEGTHHIDFQSYPLTDNAVFFVGPGQVHQLDSRNRPEGWVITFSQAFLQHNHISEDFINEINLFHSFEVRPPLILESETAQTLDQILPLMQTCFQQTNEYTLAALSAYLKLVLVYCAKQCQLTDAESGDLGQRGRQILREFKRLVSAHFRSLHKTSDYAEKMFISPKYLNEVVKSLLGKTAKEIIQEKITLNAKRELRYTHQSIKEIAFGLGFDDPLYFSSFFKNCTGSSPSSFRKEAI